jgi:hypothetical protein
MPPAEHHCDALPADVVSAVAGVRLFHVAEKAFRRILAPSTKLVEDKFVHGKL